ncbi:anti-sigma factor family protein [Isachenkonia alkalipeptolytica]|uniref:Anti-sigma-W factor RsiW n=1 Tax=Isachenkonia alkalipeptolytica TaxID=2565777 RepID=A0AA43XK83_9CLOT|nr:zf-HC2 domain-containing protein [Isachenkonia alkalipeptolytica]NBG87916.1 zf-HC2 domain-containing protein [Isachenkonia alkalipeptolytica]
MNCKEFENSISLYIDEKLNDDEKTAFLAHKDHCSHCDRALENTEKMVGSLQELKDLKAPEGLSKSIMATLEQEEENNPREDVDQYLEESSGRNHKKWFIKQLPWMKKISLAAVMVLIITSAVILTTDRFPAPREDEMTVMESADDDAGITSMDEEESISPEEAAPEEAVEEEPPAAMEETVEPEERDGDTSETFGRDTFGMEYGKWIVILLGIGVISVIGVLRKDRKK